MEELTTGKKEQLELKHLAPYLPYGLKVLYYGIINGKEKSKIRKEHKFKCEEIEDDGGSFMDYPILNMINDVYGLKTAPIKRISLWKNYTIVEVGIKSMGLKKFYLHNYSETLFKPILHPLSDLTKAYSVEFGYVSLEDLIRSIESEHCPIKIWNELLSEHFDVFGLIEKGLAIDINTLENGRG